MNKLLAQQLIIGDPSGTPRAIQGPLKGINKLSDIIGLLITFLFPLAAIILFFVLLWGGFNFLTSGGDAEKIKAGRAKITAGVIGIVLLTISFLLAKLLGAVFGLGGGIL